MSTDALHAFLAGCWWQPAALLIFIIPIWIHERALTRHRILENAAGGLCHHARSKFKLCRDCAREFAAGEKSDGDQVTQGVGGNELSDFLGGIGGLAGSLLGLAVYNSFHKKK